MLKKNVPLISLIGVIVLLAVFIGYKVMNQETNVKPPRQANAVSNEGKVINGDGEITKPNEVAHSSKIKSPISDTDPQKGEIFIQGQVKAVDVEKRIITIDQHMDDNSVEIAPNIAVGKDAIIQNQEVDISLSEIKVGEIVGIILTKDQQARAVLVNF